MAKLITLAEAMPSREREIVETVARLRLVSGHQLSELFFFDGSSAETSARLARRTLSKLVQQRALMRIERRQGGAHGGSASWVYALGPAGRRLMAYWAGEGLPRSRSAWEPGAVWVAHTLAVSDLYVRLRVAKRSNRLELLAFDTEPACWRTYTRLGGATARLKPDAFVRLGISDGFEDVLFLEIDMASEHRGQLTRQHRAYGEYFRAGVEQVESGTFPLVLWLVPDERRARLLRDIQRRLPDAERQLFRVALQERALTAICGEEPKGASV